MAWQDQRFLLIAVDEGHADASGCSIDALTRRLRSLEAELDLDLLDSSPVWFRDGSGSVRSCSRSEFQALAREGQVGSDTTVFDITLTRMSEYRSGRFERAASDSWHRSLLDRG